jgi:predicted Rossmann fold nucleotide-binding protein DprA/Smf involved in DNA uptake
MAAGIVADERPVPTVTTTEPQVLASADPAYPARLRAMPDGPAAPSVTARGNLALLDGPLLGVFCSAQCPGRLILALYDLAQTWRTAGRTIIGGFHSPLEQECLTILLRGPAPVIICPARSIETLRIPAPWQPALAAGRLLVLSPFPAAQVRITAPAAARRNRLVAALADTVFIAHAAPGSKTEAFARQVVAWGKPLSTLPGPENAALLALGATAGSARSSG